MKILMMTNSYFPYLGGLEKSLSIFSKELRHGGHDVLIAAPYPKGNHDSEDHVVRVPAFHHDNRRGIEFSINLPIPSVFANIVKKYTPDIIHTHYPFFMGDFALRLSRQYNIPLVFSYHIMFEHYVHYLPLHNAGMKRFLVRLAAGYANMCQHVIAPSKTVQDILIRRRVRTTISVVPTGVDTLRFSKGDGNKARHKYGIPLDAPVIGHVGRLAPEKNLRFLDPCLVQFLKKHKTSHALIVGRGPSEPMIQQHVKRAGLQGRLHMSGYLDGQELIDAYHAMDVFAFASKSETQGIVLAEALAAAVPVMAINAAGVRDIIKDGVNGRLILNQNRKDFVQGLESVMFQAPSQMRALKKRALKTAQTYSISNCTRRLINVYQELLSEKPSSTQYRGNPLSAFQNRIKTDWDIIRNVVKAGEAGFLAPGKRS